MKVKHIFSSTVTYTDDTASLKQTRNNHMEQCRNSRNCTSGCSASPALHPLFLPHSLYHGRFGTFQRLQGRPLCRQFVPLPIKQRLQQRHRSRQCSPLVRVELVTSGCSIASDDYLGPPFSCDTRRIIRDFGIIWKCKQHTKCQRCIRRCRQHSAAIPMKRWK